ncbi:hypothetical protein [Longimicrobium sp.]|uniref:hypothetical protein n=1 Tax=Longimicrobium sp. TaxID=2029185 RepID=UPI002E352CBB|nr:hypothetical protein [Longimicrobium sp.]HEX6041412.1 hypothetical protein [Longimicrobium sp.]
MAEFSPTIVPLGSLADAAATASQLAQQEQSISAYSPIDISNTTTGYVPPAPDWP